MHRKPLTTAAVLAVLGILLPLAACSGNRRQPDSAAAQLAFGASMAQRGLWQEALFRFNEAERLDPQNFRVHNNLGVAYEAAGNFEQALTHYKRALELAPNSREAKSNYARFVEFYQSFKGKPKTAAGKSAPAAPTPGSGKPQLPPGPGGVERGAPGAIPPPGGPQPPTVPPRGVPQPPPGVDPPPPGPPGPAGE